MYTENMRAARQRTIERILRSGAYGTQQELQDALEQAGQAVDQSTLSRDLRVLGVRKVAGRYVLPAEEERPGPGLDYGAVVRSFVPCGPHLIVIRTEVGQAQPVAVDLDARAEPALLATLAGDDTIFVATKNRKTQAVALGRLEAWFGAQKRER